MRHTSYAQPALFAVEMGLARLWQSWGIEPDVVLGHSVGQYSAACVAGVFSLEDGARLMAERGRLFGSLPTGGRMVAVFAAAERVESRTDEFPRLSVAAYNGANTVLSGPADDLERAVAELTAEGVRCDWLDTSHAFHSALLDPVLDEFESYADDSNSVRRSGLWCATAPARPSAGNAKLDGHYWRRHARQPVQFAKSVRTLADLGCTVLLEVGPQPVLTAAALRAWPDAATAPKAIASLRRKRCRPPPDHRSPRQAVRRRPPPRLRRDLTRAGASSICPPIRSSIASTGSQQSRPRRPRRMRRAPRRSDCSRTAGSRNSPRWSVLRTAPVKPSMLLKQLAAQHNRQRSVQIDRGRPLRDPLGEIRSIASDAAAGEGTRLAADRR